MANMESKPLNWIPDKDIGYTVQRRPDGGMHFTFRDDNPSTLKHWRKFALEHLLDSDRLTRNLYDLRLLKSLSDEAVRYAIEVNTDPSVRNIRLAVVVSNDAVKQAIEKILLLTLPGGVDMALFETIEAAEAWLDRPLTLTV